MFYNIVQLQNQIMYKSLPHLLTLVVELDAQIRDVPDRDDALRVGCSEQLVLVVAAEAEDRLVCSLGRVEVCCIRHQTNNQSRASGLGSSYNYKRKQQPGAYHLDSLIRGL